MSSSLLELIKHKPDIIDETVYFCGTKKAILACIMRDDGTLSPKNTPDLRYQSGSKLADAWKAGEISLDDGYKKLDKKIKSTSLKFSKHLFLTPQRKKRLSNLLPIKKKMVIEVSQKIKKIDSNRPQALSTRLTSRIDANIQEDAPSTPSPILIVEDLIDFSQQPQGRSPTIFMAPTKPCPGFDYGRYEEALASKKWNGERKKYAPVVFEHGQWCRSKYCDIEIVRHRRLCTEFQNAKKIFCTVKFNSKNKPANEERRILHSANRYLTSDDQRKKAQLLIKAKTEVVKRLRQKDRRNAKLKKAIDKKKKKKVR